MRAPGGSPKVPVSILPTSGQFAILPRSVTAIMFLSMVGGRMRHFEDFWASVQIATSMAQAMRKMSTDENARFKDRPRARLSVDVSGRITYTSRANAVTGRVPA
jgi:hypothetical protein